MANKWKRAALAVSFTTFVTEEAAITQTDNLIREIEATEEPIGPTLRAIQDGEDQQKFLEHLVTRIAEHDRDIERMCNFHYQGFVDSIGELLKVRKHAEKLKEGVLSTNKALQRSGQPVIQQADDLDKTRRTQHNIVATVENLQLCLPVLEMYCKLIEQMDNKRYYPALKTLEQLEHTYLPRVKRYRFCEEMADNIPKLREGIKDASMSDLKDFLESIRKHSDWIGEEAMKQVHKVISLELIFLKRSGKFRTPKKVIVYRIPVIVQNDDEDGVKPSKQTNSMDDGRKQQEVVGKEAPAGVGLDPEVNPFSDEEDDSTNPFGEESEDDEDNDEKNNKIHEIKESVEEFSSPSVYEVVKAKPVEVLSDDMNPFADDLDEMNDMEDPREVTDDNGGSMVSRTDGISADVDINPFADDVDVGNPFSEDDNDANPYDTDEGVGNPFGEDGDDSNPFAEDMEMGETQMSSAMGQSLHRPVSVSLEGVTLDESSVDTTYNNTSTPHNYEKETTNPFDDNDDDVMSNLAEEDEVQRRSNIESSSFHKGLTGQNESPLIEADSNPFTEEIIEEEEEEVNAQDKVDFSPVYRCLHIYSVLGERDVFESYYRKQRGKQSKLAIQPQGNMYESLEHYQKFFYQILGFFVVEDHIMNTTEGLVTREYLDELWTQSLAKITAVLRNNSALCTNATLLLQMKDQIVLFSQTLNSYGFSTTSIYDLLFDLKDQYNEILMKKWVQVFRLISDRPSDIFDSDNYTAIVVQTEQEYDNMMRTFPFNDDSVGKISYPKRLPFSEFVPKVYHQIKEFIYACHKFSQDLHLAQTERDDMIRKSTNILLTRTLSGCLSELIKRDSLGLTELVQVTVNTIHLENACEYLEDFISNITGTTGDNIHAQGLQSTNIFRDARSEAELEIYKRLNAKVDEFLELASYDWTLDESKGHASGYIQDVISFLEGSFKAFKHLPGKVAQTACLSTCKHLANSLTDFLLDDNVRYISMGAIQQFSLDVIQCELFANSEPVPGFREGALQMTFLELRQLLDLFMAWDWSSYLADYGQSKSKYSRVNPHTAIAILEKMKDTEKKKTFLPTFKKNERDRKKLMDMVLKQLKALVTGPTTSKAQAH